MTALNWQVSVDSAVPHVYNISQDGASLVRGDAARSTVIIFFAQMEG